MRIRAVVLVLIALGLTPLVSQAALLSGQTIQGTYEYSSLGSVISGPTSVVVGPGVEFPAPSLYWPFDLDITDNQLLIQYVGTSSWTPASFNGFHLFDVNGTIPAFTSVTMDPYSNMGGFSNANISFDGDNIWVNWQGLSFDPSIHVTLNVNGGGEAIPEPATMGLAALGAAALVALRRRRGWNRPA